MEKNRILEVSESFWEAMEASDEAGMRKYAHPNCNFAHIGITCDLEKEITFYTSDAFQPTKLVFHKKDVHIFQNTAIVITDCDYSLLLDGKETTHHFAVTEVYDDNYKLVQFTFTALIY